MSTRQIPADVEAGIRRNVESGHFEDEADVMREALRLLDLRERQAQALRDSIDEGFAAIERGEGIELTAESWDQLCREADDKAERQLHGLEQAQG